jgi:hypothetical protein
VRQKIARLNFLRPDQGEAFYMRALLQVLSALSPRDLRTVTGVEYTTFQDAAEAFGLFEHENQATICLQEAVDFYRVGAPLRWLFVLLVVEGAPSPLALYERFKDRLAADYLNHARLNEDHSPGVAYQHTLKALHRLFVGHGKRMTDFGLPRVDDADDRVAFERQWMRTRQENLGQQDRLSATQRRLFDLIAAAIQAGRLDRTRCHFLLGAAGLGKTFFTNCLIDHLRCHNQICAAVATSAIAALNYERGNTAHYAFSIPVLDDRFAPLSSLMKPEDSKASLLKEAELIVWDEFPMAHSSVIAAVDALLRSVTGLDLPFGGKVFLAIGDFRQVGPVVPFGGPTEQYLASIKSSSLWEHFRTHRFDQSFRNINDPEYAAFTSTVASGNAGIRVRLKDWLQTVTELSDAANFLFPPDVLLDPSAIARRAFLSCLNVGVDEFNKFMLARVEGEASESLRRLSDGQLIKNLQKLTGRTTPSWMTTRTVPASPPKTTSTR